MTNAPARVIPFPASDPLVILLHESIRLCRERGPEWLLAEVEVRRRFGPGARLVHPSELASDEQIAAMWPIEIGDANATPQR